MTPRELVEKTIKAWGCEVTEEEPFAVVYKGVTFDNLGWDPAQIDEMGEVYNHDAATAAAMYLLNAVANRLLEHDYQEMRNADSN